jgi:hypothetical protein
MIATSQDFVQEISIPNRTDSAIKEGIDWYINKYEPLFLNMLLGGDLAVLLIAGLAVDPQIQPPVALDEVWTVLRDKIKQALLNYIYWYYRRGHVSTFTGTGETISVNENSTVISPAQKMVQVWNEMVDLNFQTVQFLNGNPDYPSFRGLASYGIWYNGTWNIREVRSGKYLDIFYKQNIFGI